MNAPLSSRPDKPRLLDQVRETIRLKHYSPKTEDAYVELNRSAVALSRKQCRMMDIAFSLRLHGVTRLRKRGRLEFGLCGRFRL